MKKIFTLFTAACLYFGQTANTQVVLNELYTDPGAGKSEFFELYNPSASAIPASLDNYTMLCFYELSGTQGWYVMDLPNLTVTAKGFFVGSAALPFNYQGVTNSTASDFSWNSAAFVANNGYVRKWIEGTANLLDGNLFYDQASVPANFNDFLFRRTSSGASYSIFLYRNGVLVNTFLGGSGAGAVITEIINMPPLYIDMTATSPDFTINFSGYGSLPVENTSANAGSDNGYIREADGACASWVKSSSQINHTPKVTNGSLGSSNGTVSVSNAINRGTPATGSTVNYDVVGAPSTAFPIEMQIYVDNGSVVGQLDATDTYVESNTEYVVSQGPFYTTFFPYNASILIVVKTSAGCLDQVLYIPNTIVLSVINYVVSFEGNQVNNITRLNWRVETNELADHFDVQRSTNGRDFTSVGIVFSSEKAGSETYSFTDPEPVAPGKIIYRLRVFNKGGKSYYSNLLLLQNKEDIKKQFVIINNPVNDRLTLSIQASNSGQMEIKIIDMMGRLMLQEKTNINKGTTLLSFPVQSNYKSGVYVVDLFDGTKHYTDKFVKQ